VGSQDDFSKATEPEGFRDLVLGVISGMVEFFTPRGVDFFGVAHKLEIFVVKF
jgi:hypothetical protein